MNLLIRFALLCAVFGGSAVSYSSESEKEFSANELKVIRNVSQNLLKVRGQERQQVVEDTDSLRKTIENVDGVLKVTGAALDKPSLTTVKSTVSETDQESLSIWQQVLQRLGATGYGEQSEREVVTAISVADLNRLEAVKSQLSQQKATLDKDLPAFWEVWKEKNQDKARVSQKLADIEEELNAIIADPENSQEKIERLRSKFRNTAAENTEKELEPTITSMTKHYRK